MNKQDIIELFNQRNKTWLAHSANIANQFPHVWELIENHLATTYNMLNIRLTNLLFSEHGQLIEYHVIEEDTMREVAIALPLELMLSAAASSADELFEYIQFDAFQTLTNLSGTPEEIAKRKELEQALRFTQRQNPGMFIDIPRMIELEDMFTQHKVFKGTTTEILQ